eukprot:441399-Rhodomonas_salina.1
MKFNAWLEASPGTSDAIRVQGSGFRLCYQPRAVVKFNAWLEASPGTSDTISQATTYAARCAVSYPISYAISCAIISVGECYAEPGNLGPIVDSNAAESTPALELRVSGPGT